MTKFGGNEGEHGPWLAVILANFTFRREYVQQLFALN